MPSDRHSGVKPKARHKSPHPSGHDSQHHQNARPFAPNGAHSRPGYLVPAPPAMGQYPYSNVRPAFVQPFYPRPSAASYQVVNAFAAQALQRPPAPPQIYYPMTPSALRAYQLPAAAPAPAVNSPFVAAVNAQIVPAMNAAVVNAQFIPPATTFKPRDPETQSLCRASLRSARDAREKSRSHAQNAAEAANTSQDHSTLDSGFERSHSQTLLLTHRVNLSPPSAPQTPASATQAQFSGPSSGLSSGPSSSPSSGPPSGAPPASSSATGMVPFIVVRGSSHRSPLDRSRAQAPLPSLPLEVEGSASRPPPLAQPARTSFSPERHLNDSRPVDSPESETPTPLDSRSLRSLNLSPERQLEKSTPRRSPQIAPLRIDSFGPLSLPNGGPLSPTNGGPFSPTNGGPFSPTNGGPFSPTVLSSPALSMPSPKSTTSSVNNSNAAAAYNSNNNAQAPPLPSTASKLLAQAKLVGISLLPPPPPPAPGPQSLAVFAPPQPPTSTHSQQTHQMRAAKGQSHSGFLEGTYRANGNGNRSGNGSGNGNGSQPSGQQTRAQAATQPLFSPPAQHRPQSQYAPLATSNSSPAAASVAHEPAAAAFSHLPFSLPAQETTAFSPSAPTSTVRRSPSRDDRLPVSTENARDALAGGSSSGYNPQMTLATQLYASQAQALTLSPPANASAGSGSGSGSGSSSTSATSPASRRSQHDSALSLGGVSTEDALPPPPLPVRAPLAHSASMPMLSARPAASAASSSAIYVNVPVSSQSTQPRLPNANGGLPTAPPPPPSKPKPTLTPALAGRMRAQNQPHSLLAASLRKSASTGLPDGSSATYSSYSSSFGRLESSSAAYYRPVPDVPVAPKMEANAMRPSSLVPPKSPTMSRRTQAAPTLSIASASASASSSASTTGYSSGASLPATSAGGSSASMASNESSSSSVPPTSGTGPSATRARVRPTPESGQLTKRTQPPSQVAHAPRPPASQPELDPRTGTAKQTGRRSKFYQRPPPAPLPGPVWDDSMNALLEQIASAEREARAVAKLSAGSSPDAAPTQQLSGAIANAIARARSGIGAEDEEEREGDGDSDSGAESEEAEASEYVASAGADPRSNRQAAPEQGSLARPAENPVASRLLQMPSQPQPQTLQPPGAGAQAGRVGIIQPATATAPATAMVVPASLMNAKSVQMPTQLQVQSHPLPSTLLVASLQQGSSSATAASGSGKPTFAATPENSSGVIGVQTVSSSVLPSVSSSASAATPRLAVGRYGRPNVPPPPPPPLATGRGTIQSGASSLPAALPSAASSAAAACELHEPTLQSPVASNSGHSLAAAAVPTNYGASIGTEPSASAEHVAAAMHNDQYEVHMQDVPVQSPPPRSTSTRAPSSFASAPANSKPANAAAAPSEALDQSSAASSASSQDAWVAGASASNRKSILRTSRYSFQQPAPSSPTPTPSAPQFGTDAAPATASGDPASALATRPVAETAPASLLSRALDLPTSLPPEQVSSTGGTRAECTSAPPASASAAAAAAASGTTSTTASASAPATREELMKRNLVKFEQLLARGSAASSGRPRSSSQSGSGSGGEEEEDEKEEEEEESTDSSSDDEGGSEYVITGKFGAMKITGGGPGKQKQKLASESGGAESPTKAKGASASRALDDSFVGSRRAQAGGAAGRAGGRQRSTCITVFRAKPKGLGLPTLRAPLPDPSENKLRPITEADELRQSAQQQHEVAELVLEEDEEPDDEPDEPLFSGALLATTSPFTCVRQALSTTQTIVTAIAAQPSTPAIVQAEEMLSVAKPVLPAAGCVCVNTSSGFSSSSFSSASTASYGEDDELVDDLCSTLSDTFPPPPSLSPQEDSRRAALRSAFDELDASARGRTALDSSATCTPLRMTNGCVGMSSSSCSSSPGGGTRVFPAASAGNTPTRHESPPHHPLLLAEKSAARAQLAVAAGGGADAFSEQQPADIYENFSRAARTNQISTSTTCAANALPSSFPASQLASGSQSCDPSSYWTTPSLVSPAGEESEASLYSNTLFVASSASALKPLESAPYYLSSTGSSTLGSTCSDECYSNCSFTSPPHRQMPEAAESESSYYSNFAVTRKGPMNGRAPGRERVVFGAEAGRGGGTSLASSCAVAKLEAMPSFAVPTRTPVTDALPPPPAAFSDGSGTSSPVTSDKCISPSPSRRYISAPSPAPPAQPVAAAAATAARSACATAAESVQVPSQPAAHDIYLPVSSPARLTSAPALSIAAPVAPVAPAGEQLIWRDPAPLSATAEGSVALIAPAMSRGRVREPPPVIPTRSPIANKPFTFA